ncbi:MAG TPA: histidine kinase [Chryseolinea sp.]|nr:histidine kinase [Chryseolinea sp.]
MSERSFSYYKKWIRIVGIPFFILELYLNQQFNEGLSRTMLLQFGKSTVLLIVQWFIVELFIAYFRKLLPAYRHTPWRIVLSIICSGTAGSLLIFLLNRFPQIINGQSSLTIKDLIADYIFFFSTTLVVLYEIAYNFYTVNRIEKEKEELQKAHLRSQLDSLKNQVNPHFLFNSLNTLLALIPEAPKKAEQFVENLAAVYRHLLQSNDSGTTTVQEQLRLIDSYFHLLKTRYDDALALQVAVDEELMDFQLPSLTLQLLVENAVKHNIISPAQPLTIEIVGQKRSVNLNTPQISIRNNLQRRVSSIPSTRLGLTNIAANFKLLGKGEISITDENGYFSVTLPLFKLAV